MRLLRFALHEVRASRLRALISGFSMLLGVVAITSGVLALGAVTDHLVAREERTSGRAYTFGAAVDSSHATTVALAREASRHTTDRGWAVAAEVRDSAELIRHDVSVGATLLWFTDDPDRIYRRPVITGRTEHASTSLAVPISVNERLADDLALDALPQEISIRKGDRAVSARIVGIRRDGSVEAAAYGRYSDAPAVNPLVRDLGATISVTGLARSSSDVDLLLRGAGSRVGITEAITSARADSVDAARAEGAQISVILLGSGTLVLAVSALGILNVGLASVRERSRELAVRRAFGAKRWEAFAQVISGTTLISLAVALIGGALLLAVSAGIVPTGLGPEADDLPFPWAAAGWGMGAAVLTGASGGLIPALSATRRPVTSILRS